MLNFRKIASILSSAVMISSTVGLAAAANYPVPFVSGGAADVAIVYGGSKAAASDLAAAASIQSQLATELAKATATGSGDSGTSVSGGDYVKLTGANDKVNLGDQVSTAFGSTSVDNEDLTTLLADGTYRNNENTEYNYEQTVTLAGFSLTAFADSDYKSKEPTLGISLASNAPVLNYTIDFTTDAESDVGAGGASPDCTTNNLCDFEQTTLKFLGKEYYVSDFTNTSSNWKITLLDTANSATVKEGETVTVSKFDVSIYSLTTTQARLNINGEITNNLREGESYKLSDGTYVGIKDIFQRDVAGVVGTVEFSLGTGKLELTNGATIELNDESVKELKSYVTAGTASGGKEKLDKIIIEWVTDDDEFVTPTQSLTMPGFQAIKLSMGEFYQPSKDVVTVDYEGDDSVRIEAPIKDGTAKFNILYANSSGEFIGIGKAADERLVTSTSGTNITFNITSGVDEWFVASYNTSTDSESYLLSVSDVTDKDGYNRTTIRNEITGTEVCKEKIPGNDCKMGSVSISIESAHDAGSHEYSVIKAGTNVNFNTLYTKSGLKVYLPYPVINGSVAKGSFNVSDDYNNHYASNNAGSGAGHNTTTQADHGRDTYKVFFAEEDKNGNVGSGDVFNITLNDDSDGKLHISVVDTGNTNLEIPGTDDDTVSYTYGDVNTEVKRIVASDRGKAVITYSGAESYADVFLTALGAEVTSSGSSTGTATELGSVIVEDANVASVSGKNLVVVGGSCINTVAASLLGSDVPLCGADFTAATQVGAGQYLIKTYESPYSSAKVATLVAGYNAGDTTAASTYLRTQTVAIDKTAAAVIGPASA